MNLKTPPRAACDDYTTHTSFEQYVQDRGCDWDAYACCFQTRHACAHVCLHEGYTRKQMTGFVLLGVFLILCCIAHAPMRRRYHASLPDEESDTEDVDEESSQ
jgi:hypothetical protein